MRNHVFSGKQRKDWMSGHSLGQIPVVLQTDQVIRLRGDALKREETSMKKLIVLGMLAGAVVTVINSPPLAARATALVTSWTNWTDAARRADPEGYFASVRAQLQRDLGRMRTSREQLRGQSEELAAHLEDTQRLAMQSGQMAEEFRAAWSAGAFPVQLFGRAYTAEQLQEQVALLLDQRDQYERNVQSIHDVESASCERFRDLCVQIDQTTNGLSLLETQKQLLISRQLQTAGSDLMAQVEQLVDDNARVLTLGPVRPVSDLLAAASQQPAGGSPGLDRALTWLQSSKEPVAHRTVSAERISELTGPAGCLLLE